MIKYNTKVVSKINIKQLNPNLSIHTAGDCRMTLGWNTDIVYNTFVITVYYDYKNESDEIIDFEVKCLNVLDKNSGTPNIEDALYIVKESFIKINEEFKMLCAQKHLLILGEIATLNESFTEENLRSRIVSFFSMMN